MQTTIIRSSQSHSLLRLRNGLRRVQPFWTSSATIENRMASVQTHAVIERVFTLVCLGVTAVG